MRILGLKDCMPDDKLPPLNRYVLIHYNRGNWMDQDQEGCEWKVAKRIAVRVSGNDVVPYAWEEFGMCKYFATDIDRWEELPRKAIL